MEAVRCIAYLVIHSWNNKYESKQIYGKAYLFILNQLALFINKLSLDIYSHHACKNDAIK